MPEPRPEPRAPAQFVRELEPSPRAAKRAAGKKRKPVTRRDAKATKITQDVGLDFGRLIGRYQPLVDPSAATKTAARDLLRKRLQDELTETEAYAAELRRVLAGV